MSFGGAELAIIGRLSERRFNLSHSDARILLTAAEATACEAAEPSTYWDSQRMGCRLSNGKSSLRGRGKLAARTDEAPGG